MTATADATDSSTVEKLTQAVTDLQQTIKQQAERIDHLERELENQSTNVTGAFAKLGQLDERISTVENQQTDDSSENEPPIADADGSVSTNEHTPLERIAALPEHIAKRELTANQERARFIARDVYDYGEKVPAGLVIDSRAIKRVITAAEGKRPHTQTVARVMNFLDELGKDGVQLKKRRGKKFVVVDPAVADRLTNVAAHHDRCDRGTGDASPETVISG